MRRKAIECDVCGEKADGWYVFETEYRDILSGRYSKKICVCWNCMQFLRDLIREERGL